MVRRVIFCLAILTVLFGIRAPLAAQPGTIRGSALSVDIHGNIFVLDDETSTLRMFSKQFTALREVGGQGWENDQFDHPAGIWARNGIDIYVADFGNHRIQRFDRSLTLVSTLSTRENENPDERFGYPSDVALSRQGDLFICDTENSRIVKVNVLNGSARPFGGFGAGGGRLLHPKKVQIGPRDNVYVLDPPRVAIFDNFGNYTGDLGQGMFRDPISLFGDEDGVAVLDSAMVYLFDSRMQPSAVRETAVIAGQTGPRVRDLAIMNGKLFVLTDSGIFGVPDPRKNLEER